MWDWSDAALAQVRNGQGDQTLVCRAEILQSGKPTGVLLDITDGGVTRDVSRPVLANLDATLTDATGDLSQADLKNDLLDPFVAEIAPWRGVQYIDANGNTVSELAPLGVFALTGREVDDSPDGLVIRLAGQDRAMTYQGPMDSALGISGGTPVETAIGMLLAARQPRVGFHAMASGFTCGPLIYPPDTDVWDAALKLAESVGARLYHDRLGVPVLEPAGPASDRPVAEYLEGGGLLLSVNRQEDSDTVRNVVVAENPAGTIRAVAEDTDPLSPTYARGRYGRRVYTLVNEHFASTDQAMIAATARLAYELGRSETVSFSAVPDPGLDVDEVVTVHRPRAGLTYRGVVVASIDLPLTATDYMRVGCRQSRLALDGRVLDPLVTKT